MNYKEQLLELLQRHIFQVREKIAMRVKEIRERKSVDDVKRMSPDDQVIYMKTEAQRMQRLEQFDYLHETPFFAKCEVIYSDTGEKKIYFFAKHQYTEESIYSWVAPVATIRFENIGPTSFQLPNGRMRHLNILSKEQYMIVNGRVMFFAREMEGRPRELIYQENFTTHKSKFLLPEIVAKMEKAQDQVIRAHFHGPLVISGPAGSGKTTLALHRVAYLTQAPDTAALYPLESIIVFVQDKGTKEYFSHLLPELGIHNVVITTFSEWAFTILEAKEYTYTIRYGDSEEERNLYEYQKLEALHLEHPKFEKDIFAVLRNAYKKHLVQYEKLFEKQYKEQYLDRFDLTILLRSYLAKYGHFESKRYSNAIVNGIMKRRIQRTVFSYSLIVVDEFQNYLPEQLEILKKCVYGETNSMIYVGDMGQQVYLGTIQHWEDLGEVIASERSIQLDKVYRNTKNILIFIQNLGYNVSIPDGLKDGPDILEKITQNKEEEIAHIKKVAQPYEDGAVGVLAQDEEYLILFKKELAQLKHVHVMTMNQSQGVEFDLVVIVGINREMFLVTDHESIRPVHIKERKRIKRDLLYVALTRAITELHVLGKEKLKEILTINRV